MFRDTSRRIGVLARMISIAAPAFRSLQLPARNAGRVAQCAENLVGFQTRQVRTALHIGRLDFAVCTLGRPKQRSHSVQGLRRRARLLDIVEEIEKRLGAPFGRQTEQAQQIPDFDGMYLHRRCGQQDQSLDTLFQSAHQLEQGIRTAFPLAARAAPPGMMRLVEHQQIPGFRLTEESLRSVGPGASAGSMRSQQARDTSPRDRPCARAARATRATDTTPACRHRRPAN